MKLKFLKRYCNFKLRFFKFKSLVFLRPLLIMLDPPVLLAENFKPIARWYHLESHCVRVNKQLDILERSLSGVLFES